MTLTGHGYHIAGTTDQDEGGKKYVARCGGPKLCGACMLDASRVTNRDVEGEDMMSKAFNALVESGQTKDQALDIINSLQSAGFIFRLQ